MSDIDLSSLPHPDTARRSRAHLIGDGVAGLAVSLHPCTLGRSHPCVGWTKTNLKIFTKVSFKV